jgi:hypothetical protein
LPLVIDLIADIAAVLDRDDSELLNDNAAIAVQMATLQARLDSNHKEQEASAQFRQLGYGYSERRCFFFYGCAGIASADNPRRIPSRLDLFQLKDRNYFYMATWRKY